MYRNIKNYILFVFTTALLLTGCSGVDTQVSRNVNFNAYKTFAWMPAKENTDNPKFKGPLVEQNIKENVENELAEKGIMRNDQNPDFLIDYHTYTEEKQGVDPGYSSPFMGPYYGGYGGFYGGGFYGNPYYGYYGGYP